MADYQKQFDEWNSRKKLRDGISIPYDFFFHEREVWWCSVGVNVGAEIDGKNNDFERPVLIVRKFNREMFWGIPLTSKEKKHPAFIEIHHDRGISYANTSQLRTWSTKRLLRRVGMISQDEYGRVCETIQKSLTSITIEPRHGDGVLGGRSH